MILSIHNCVTIIISIDSPYNNITGRYVGIILTHLRTFAICLRLRNNVEFKFL